MADETATPVAEPTATPKVNKNPPVPLTSEELLTVWQQDEFWGQSGIFESDPFTGKRTQVGA